MQHYFALCLCRGKESLKFHQMMSWKVLQKFHPLLALVEVPLFLGSSHYRNRLLALLSWQRSGKMEPVTVHIVNACLEISKLPKTFKCAVTWTGFKIQHCTVRNPASSSPVLNLPFVQKVVWKEDASQNQHLSSSNFWITITQASGWLLEGKENIIYCGQWSPWGSGRKPGVHPDVSAQPRAASTLRGVQWEKLFLFALKPW